MMPKKQKPSQIQTDNLESQFKTAYSEALASRFTHAAYSIVEQYDTITGYGESQEHSNLQSTPECEIKYQQHLAIVKAIGLVSSKKYKVNIAKQVIEVLEDLEAKGYILNFLSPLSGIELANNKYAVISYPAIKQEGIKYLEETYSNLLSDEGEELMTLEQFNALSKK